MRLIRVRPRVRVLAGASLVAILTVSSAAQSSSSPAWLAPYRDTAARLIKASTADDFAWQRLAELTDTFGPRLSGSENLVRAVRWSAEAMKQDGLENVRTERVMVPNWVRGHERAEIIHPQQSSIEFSAGGTVATPPGGVEANPGRDELRRTTEPRGYARGASCVQCAVHLYGVRSLIAPAGAGPALQGAVAVLVACCRSDWLRTTHTGACHTGKDAPSRRGDCRRRRESLVRLGRPGPARERRLTLSGARAGRRIGQRRR